MAPSSRDRISVDLRGLRTALLAHARARGLTPSDLVRSVLAEAFSAVEPTEARPASARTSTVCVSRPTDRVRLSLRMTAEQARAIATAAKTAGLPAGDFVAGLVAGIPALSSHASRSDHLAALIVSSAEMSTLSRNIHYLTSLLRQGAVRPALEYRAMLDTLAGDVRGHLTLAAGVLADLRPRARAANAPKHPTL